MDSTETRPMAEHDPAGYVTRLLLIAAVEDIRQIAAFREAQANRADSALSGTRKKETVTETWDRGYLRGLATAYHIAAKIIEQAAHLDR